MGPGSLRRAIERKSPMLLHRSVRTGSSILANYSANGLCPVKRASRAQLRIPGRMEFSERTGAGTGQPRASSIFIDPLHEYAASGYGLFPFVPPARPSTFGNSLPWGTGFLVMPSSTLRYISAVTLLLQCTSGNAVLAQEGQATTATASANDRGEACVQSIEKVINLCMMRGLNNIGRVNCDCVQDGRKWTCTGAATCAK